jgi:hypothetical protein
VALRKPKDLSERFGVAQNHILLGRKDDWSASREWGSFPKFRNRMRKLLGYSAGISVQLGVKLFPFCSSTPPRVGRETGIFAVAPIFNQCLTGKGVAMDKSGAGFILVLIRPEHDVIT